MVCTQVPHVLCGGLGPGVWVRRCESVQAAPSPASWAPQLNHVWCTFLPGPCQVTIEEREEYEQHIKQGTVVYAGTCACVAG